MRPLWTWLLKERLELEILFLGLGLHQERSQRRQALLRDICSSSYLVLIIPVLT